MGSISTSRSERAIFHPFAWWGWALALTVALFIASDPFYAAGVTLASAVVVRRFRSDHPWSKSFATAMRLVVVIVTIRLAIAVVIGVPIPGTTLVTLPTLVTPEWIAGIRIGGPVTLERVSTTFSEVMIIVGVIALIAAATSLTSPHRLIRSIPFAFYQLTLILTVATSVIPQLVTSIKRIQMARRLRGQAPGGLRNWRKIAMPLLEESLERSLDLAAAMESRGFGQRIRRTRYRPDKWRRLDNLLLLTAATSVVLLSLANSSSMSLVAGIFAAGMVAKPR